MSWLEKIRSLNPAAKLKFIWVICGLVVLLLILVWVASAKFHKNIIKDISLFQTISKGFRDVKDNYKK